MSTNLFHEMSVDEIHDRERDVWTLDAHFPFWKGPEPMHCDKPWCPDPSPERLQLRQFKFFTKTSWGSENIYRCDVHYKCRTCSFIISLAGVNVPEKMWRWAEEKNSKCKEISGFAFKWRWVKNHVGGCTLCQNEAPYLNI